MYDCSLNNTTVVTVLEKKNWGFKPTILDLKQTTENFCKLVFFIDI